ncbi:hypothetical protein KI387_006487, partial [Taxus chinensis]
MEQKGSIIQFYDSFTYDGVEYSLLDCVYLQKKDEPEPYIGKITKIWEDRKLRKNKIKVLWFFRPIEIRNWLKEVRSPANKEIFLASGEGKGVFNINLLEMIVGKCKVICTSADPRNPKPSEEDMNNADYFYNRTFDVDNHMVSESFAGIEAEIAFNKNGTITIWGNKSMANGSLLSGKGEAKPGISGVLNKRKVDRIRNEGELKQAKTSEKKPNNNETQNKEMKQVMTLNEKVKGNETLKEELKMIETAKEERKGNETTNEELKTIETAREEQKNGTAKEEIKKSDILKDELKNEEFGNEESNKIETVKKETERNENSNDERRKSESVNQEPTKAESEMPSKIAANVDSPKQCPQLEVRSNEKKGNNNETSKEKKKPIKRARIMVDSDEEANGMMRLQTDGSEIATRKKTDSKKEFSAPENRVVKKAKLSDNFNKTSEKMAKTAPQLMELSKEKKLGREIVEITKRPDVESKKWFKVPAWDECLQNGYDQRAVIRIQNFDPSYTSSEIDDVIWHMLGERCTTKVMPRTVFSNPKFGDALVIFRTREGADNSSEEIESSMPNFFRWK